MTREEIRWIAVGKLGMSANSVVWDVGAGTGSVSVECAGRCPSGKVIAIEKIRGHWRYCVRIRRIWHR